MASPAAPDLIRPLPKPPGHEHRNAKAPDQPVRHVSFSNLPRPSGGAAAAGKPRLKRSCCMSCCVCCAWTFLVCLVLVFLLVLAAVGFYLWARPQLPRFHVQRIAVPTLQLARSSDLTHLTSRIDVSVASSNRNKKLGFEYDRIKIQLSSLKHVTLGRARVPSFKQSPNNVTVAKVHAGVNNALIPADEGIELSKRFRQKALVLDLELEANVRLLIGKWRSGGVNVRVLCSNIDTSKGTSPKCQIFFLGSRFGK